MTPFLEYCTLHYLEQWFCHEESFHVVLNGVDWEAKLAALKKAAYFFGVARNLPTQFDIEIGLSRFEPVLNVLERRDHRFIDNASFINLVTKVRSSISDRYGGRDTLSLSTKFLWLIYRDPFIIYDSRVRNALGVEEGRYDQFVDQWSSQYRLLEPEIQRKCSVLPNFRNYIRCGPSVSQEQVRMVCSETWFCRRVFDIYLWHKQ